MATTTNTSYLAQDTVWQDKKKYEDAERNYQEGLAKRAGNRRAVKCSESDSANNGQPPALQSGKCVGEATKIAKQNKNKEKKSKKENKGQKVSTDKGEVVSQGGHTEITGFSEGMSSLVDEISRARQQIKNSLQRAGGRGQISAELSRQVAELENENKRLAKVTDELRALISKLEARVSSLELGTGGIETQKTSAPAAPQKKDVKEATADEEDIDLFGSDEEDNEEKERLHQERLKAYETKKSKKPALIAKSNIILDVKPWDDETDMKAMESQVRLIAMDGLVWGASKLVPLAYGIHKLQISCVVEDEIVSVDLLQEEIEGLEELVQSVDIAAFNKV